MASEDSRAVYQTLDISLTFQGTSTLDRSARNAIERHLEAVFLREVDSLDQPQEVIQTSSDQGEITTFMALPLVFKRACLMCLEAYAPSDAKLLRCGHVMCRTCAQTRFNIAIHQETSYPPGCCEVIELAEVEFLLNEAIVQQYKEKEIEYRCTNRTYCHNKPCHKFIPPNQISHGVAPCEDCETHTCVICKEEAHMDDCVIAEEEILLWKTVEENGWRRCKCGRVIERDEGCSHMTWVCPEIRCLMDSPNSLLHRCEYCRAEWCYGCGVTWPRHGEPAHGPKCRDPFHDFDPAFGDEEVEDDDQVDRVEPNIDHAERGITGEEQDPDGNEENGPQANPEAGQETDPIQVQENQPGQAIDPYHRRPTSDQRNCLHRNAWFYISNPSTCQICQWYANLFILVCHDCNLSACRACTTSQRIRALRDSTPVEQVAIPRGGSREPEDLADDHWAEVAGSVAGPSTESFGLGLTEADAQAHATDAEDKVQKAREHMAAVRKQLAEAQKRLSVAEEGLELVSLDNEAAVRLLSRFEA